MWRDCLLGAVTTLTVPSLGRCKPAICGWTYMDFDLESGYRRWAGWEVVNVKILKNNQFRQGHQPRQGLPRDPRLNVVKQLLAFMRAVGNGPRPGCTKRAIPQCPCPVCPPFFPSSVERGWSFNFSLLTPCTCRLPRHPQDVKYKRSTSAALPLATTFKCHGEFARTMSLSRCEPLAGPGAARQEVASGDSVVSPVAANIIISLLVLDQVCFVSATNGCFQIQARRPQGAGGLAGRRQEQSSYTQHNVNIIEV
jgi:hypothetical protein